MDTFRRQSFHRFPVVANQYFVVFHFLPRAVTAAVMSANVSNPVLSPKTPVRAP
jgi:hypothetical protein